MRTAAVILVVALGTLPLAVWPSVPVTWLAVPALVVGGAGAIVLSVPLVTVGATLALIAYALALVIAKPVIDPFAAMAFGATLVLLLTLVHFAGSAQGALVGRAVIMSQLRRSLVITGIGVLAALGLTVAAAGLAPLFAGAALPVVVVIAALGALLTGAGVIALLTREGS